MYSTLLRRSCLWITRVFSKYFIFLQVGGVLIDLDINPLFWFLPFDLNPLYLVTNLSQTMRNATHQINDGAVSPRPDLRVLQGGFRYGPQPIVPTDGYCSCGKREEKKKERKRKGRN